MRQDAVTDQASAGAARPSRRRARWAIGTAVLGRPAYINTTSAADLPTDRTVDAMRDNTFAVLDAARAAGVDWVDTARSYGRAEEFVGQWWRSRVAADPDWATRAPTVSSKWGYAYVGDWDPNAEVHEVKEHTRTQLERQWELTRQNLPVVSVYQVHSLTSDSPVFDDHSSLDALAELRDAGVAIGFSTSGPDQSAAIHRAMGVERAGARLFSAVQATWNLLETSAGDALAEASRGELTVLVKESLANGRLVAHPPAPLQALADKHGATPDAVALAAVAQQQWADRVLLGPAGVRQLASNLRADAISLDADDVERLGSLVRDRRDYWSERSALVWK